MIKKFLATASVAGLIVGSAAALGVTNQSDGNGGTNAPVLLAAELDFGAGVSSVPAVGAAGGQTQIEFIPTGTAFPTGNVLVYVDVTGATFDGALSGVEVEGTSTSVISSGGAAGGTSVVFLVSGANNCAAVSPCRIDLPLDLTGSDVTFAVGLQTDAGAPVDNSSATNRQTVTVVDVETAWDVAFTPDATPPVANLNAVNGPFADFLPTGPADLGDFQVGPNVVNYGTVAVPVNVAAVTDLSGTLVSAADVGGLEVVLSGQMDAFAAPGSVTFDGSAATVSTVNDTATITQGASPALFGAAPRAVMVTDDVATAIQRSSYTVSIDLDAAASSPLTAGTTATGAISPIVRNGTQITFPWTQSQTQGAASGVNSVFRFGNLDASDAGAVFVEVKNASQAGYTNPGIVQLATSIAGNGELVTNSTALEAALGNYGRGDLEFTVEAEADTLTGRQFVVRNGVIQQVIGGNIEQDLQ